LHIKAFEFFNGNLGTYEEISGQQIRMALAPPASVASIQHAEPHKMRPYADFPPNIWGHFFLQYDSESLVLIFYIYNTFFLFYSKY